MVGLVGCGESQGPTGTVTGKAVLGTEPLRDANVQLCGKDGVPIAVAGVDSTGKFTFDKPIPVGQYKVIVLPAGQELPAGAEGAAPPTTGPKIPAKYRDSLQSDLKADVKAGENSLSLELK